MRVKSDEKRHAIIEAANRLFREIGFEKTSMSKIVATVGGSKATLYNYFPSKEELFVECMMGMIEDYLEESFQVLTVPDIPLPEALHRFARDILRLVCSPELIASRRRVIAEAERSGIGSVFKARVHNRQQQLVDYLNAAMARGQLRCDNATVAARQIRALIEGDLFEDCLLSTRTTPPEEAEVEQAARLAIDTFLRAYAPTST